MKIRQLLRREISESVTLGGIDVDNTKANSAA